MHQEGILAEPLPTWMVYRRPLRCLEGTKRTWERFSPQDSDALERIHSSKSTEEVHVHFRRYTANVHNRWMQAFYWKENKWPIVRGTWFWRDSADGVVCPFGEADATTLEEAYCDMLTGQEDGPIDCELVDTDIVSGTVQFVKEDPAPSAKSSTSPPSPRRPPSISYSLYRPFDVTNPARTERLEVFREFPTAWVPTSEEQLAPEVSHLVLAVHGIGEALYNRQNDPQMGSMRFRGNCDLVRENLNNKLLEMHKGTGGGSAGRIEVLPLEWSEAIHSNFLDRRLEAVTLPNLAGVRDFANLALTDVFLYTQSDIQERISVHIRERIATLIAKFKQRNTTSQSNAAADGAPSFGVSFIGHSLGGVVLFDLFTDMARQAATGAANASSKDTSTGDAVGTGGLGFDPEAIFFLGSPLAMFLTIRDPFRSVESSGEAVLNLPLYPNCRTFNIFHPYDAIAYRLEPLIDMRLRSCEPAVVPYKGGGHRVHVAIRKGMATVISSIGDWLSSSAPAPVISVAIPHSSPASHPKHPSSSSSSASSTSGAGGGSTPRASTEKEEIRRVKNLNFNERIDWALQESAVESVSEWMAAVGSHFTYWRHEDVYHFIVARLVSIGRARDKGVKFFQAPPPYSPTPNDRARSASYPANPGQ